MSAFNVVALRTAGATLLLFVVLLLFNRPSLYIYPLGFLGCLLAGLINGAGSVFYYQGLSRVDAGLGQLLYSLYPIFVALLLYFDGYKFTPMTLARIGLSLPALLLLTSPSTGGVNSLGALMMVVAGILYALHIPINQRVLFEAPAPTVTFYTLASMTAVVVPVALLQPYPILQVPRASLWPIVTLTLVTFFARLSLFTGVKSIGGLDTALIGLGEIVITLGLAHIWLGESLTRGQWLGALLLGASLLLLPFDRRRREEPPIGGWLHWLLPRARLQRADPEERDDNALSADTTPDT